MFVKLHSNDWRLAQAHWEEIVERVLNSDAIESWATGERAVQQAVGAAVRLLVGPDLRGRCPVCRRPPRTKIQRTTKPTEAEPGNTAPFSHAAAAPHRLVGRESELSQLRRLANDVSRGRGQALLVEGEPGIGKSSLVGAACSETIGLGCQVFWGAGDELGQTLPLLPVLDALRVRESTDDQRRTTIIRLLRGDFPTEGRADPSPAAVEQVLALVRELCAIAPMVLVIDDLQWADQVTVTVWERLARLVNRLPLLLVGMTRPVPQRTHLAALKRMVGAEGVLRLGPLTEPAVGELVEVLVGHRPGADLLRLANDAAGNPLYLTELIAAFTRSARLEITVGVAEVTHGPGPRSLAAAIMDRLGFLEPRTRDVLRTAALLGVEFSVSDLAAASGRRVTDLLPALDEARAASVLSDADDGLAFRHPLIRTALYDDMPAAMRAAWHHDAGRALAEAGAPVDRVARQLLRAVDGTGEDATAMIEWAAHWLIDAAPLLVGQAPRAAVELLRRAVTHLPAGAARRDELACRLAEALYRVGDTVEAEHVAVGALEQVTDPDLLVDLHCTLTQCRAMTGRSAESLAALDKALTFEGANSDHRARLLVLKARTYLDLGQVETAGRVASGALEEATETGDRWSIAWALLVQTSVAGMRGDITTALTLMDRALAVAEGHAELTDLRLLLQINQACAFCDLDRREEALAVIQRVRHQADRTGNAVRITQAQNVLGQLLFYTGRWDDALAEVDVLPDNLKGPDATCCDHGIAAVIDFHRGDADAARRHLAAAAPSAERIGNRVIASLALARSLDAEHAGEPERALAALTTGLANDSEELAGIEDLLADAVRLAVEIDDLRTATGVMARVEALGRGSTVTHRRAASLYCQGLLERDPTKLLQAAELYCAATLPLWCAKALEVAAIAFVESRNRTEARAAFGQALDQYTSLGAAWDLARLHERFWHI
jgi:tetratricopeptide (TPR) repeat protein